MLSPIVSALLLAVLPCLTAGQATECETLYHGHCIGILSSCRSGEKSMFSHCGFLSWCCYDDSRPQVTQAPSGHVTLGPQVTCGNPAVTGHRIVGGSIAQPGEFPWQVSLRYNGYHMCGGTLVDSNWIVTAAHCFDDTSANGWSVVIGMTDQNNVYSNMIHRTAHILRHAGYKKDSNMNDIAMIRLDRSVAVGGVYIRPACLPHASDSFDSVTCTVTGWGATHSGGSGTRQLLKAEVPIVSNSLCRYYMGSRNIFEHNLCAGFTNGGKDACQGDSGGPLVCKTSSGWKLAGIVSWGYGCGNRNELGVYTRVTAFLDWIENTKRQYP